MKNLIKRITLTGLLTLVFSIGFSQKLYKKDLLNLEKSVYKKALKNYDLEVAKNAVYRILELEGKQSTYLDTLAYIYFKQQNYLSCLQVSNKILKEKEKKDILEFKAVSLEKLHDIKSAIDVFEKIYAINKDAVSAYKLAQLQQQLKRAAEAYETLKSGENLKFPEKLAITFPTAKKGEVQNVPFKAAFYNLMALTAYDLHNYDMAIRYYDKALKIYPDFFLAKQNKAVVKMMKDKLEKKNDNSNK